MAEMPIVVVNVQRGGPSTGMPTNVEQSDLMQAVFGRHGESPLAVLAASSPRDCFDAAVEAIAADDTLHEVILSGGDPLLLDDASIVFNARGTVLVRQDACRREARWVRNGPYHHSIERDAEGMLWVGGVGDGAWLGNPQRAARFRDDTLVRVSPDGEALE